MRPEETHNEKNAAFTTDVVATDAGIELTRIANSDGGGVVTASLVGRVLGGHYEVMEELGSGGMSAVYLCRHRGLDRLVALKVLHLDHSASKINRRRFELEAKATFDLNHPNLIRLLDYSVDEAELPYLVMEYVPGRTLSDILFSDGRFDLQRFVSVFTQVCDGLSYAHAAGIVHRDLKPSNIMITQRPDGTEQVKIVDFGIAKIIQQEKDQQLTRTGDIFGSPLYMSPEQCKGLSPDNRSDLYSLGCAMYECLTGDPPFRAENAMQTMFMHVEKTAPPLNLDKAMFGNSVRAVEELVLRLLSKDPVQRFANAVLVKERLLDCLNPSSHANAQIARRPRSGLNAPILVAAAIAIVLLGAGAAMFFLHSGSKASSEKIEVARAIAATAEEQQSKKDRDEDALAAIKICTDQSAIYRNKFDYVKAAVESKEALSLAQGTLPKDGEKMRELLISYGVDTFFSGTPDSASIVDETFSRVEPLLPAHSNCPEYAPLHQANVYGWHGVALFNLKKYKQAYAHFCTAQSICEQLHDVVQELQWMDWRAHTLSTQGKLDEALVLYEQEELLAGNKHPLQLFISYEHKALDLFNAGRVEEARACLRKAIKLAEHNRFDPASNEMKVLEAQKKLMGVSDHP